MDRGPSLILTGVVAIAVVCVVDHLACVLRFWLDQRKAKRQEEAFIAGLRASYVKFKATRPPPDPEMAKWRGRVVFDSEGKFRVIS